MDLEGILVPIALFIMSFGIVYVIVTARNRQVMAMIENGADPKLFKPDPRFKVFNTLRNALLLIGVGIGIFLASILEEYTSIQSEPIYFGLIFLFGGLGLLGAFLLRDKVIKKSDNNNQE